jgi:hypothetical protein
MVKIVQVSQDDQYEDYPFVILFKLDTKLRLFFYNSKKHKFKKYDCHIGYFWEKGIKACPYISGDDNFCNLGLAKTKCCSKFLTQIK